jgi:hypothetical protein
MSKAASWSYVAKATHWALLDAQAWGDARSYDTPVTFLCDYSTATRRAVNKAGAEVVTQLTIYTERNSIKDGDRVALGVFTEFDPLTVEASREVATVLRNADTLDGRADDFEVLTS